MLKPILEDTYGIIVYQEQVLGILMQMAGYTMGKADIVRKAIGKKNRELMAKEEPRFIEGCVKERPDRRSGPHAVESDPAVRRLLIQPRPLDAVRPAELPDRLSQDQLSDRVYGGAACRRRRAIARTWRGTSARRCAWAWQCCRRMSTSPSSALRSSRSIRAARGRDALQSACASACRRSRTSATGQSRRSARPATRTARSHRWRICASASTARRLGKRVL